MAKRVLIVEDDENLRELLAVLLAGRGALVFQAGDGITGLIGILRDDPDVVLLDIAMPRMNGIEMLRELTEQQIRAGYEVIVMTAFSERGDEARAAGADNVLIKPFEMDTLYSMIGTNSD